MGGCLLMQQSPFSKALHRWFRHPFLEVLRKARYAWRAHIPRKEQGRLLTCDCRLLLWHPETFQRLAAATSGVCGTRRT